MNRDGKISLYEYYYLVLFMQGLIHFKIINLLVTKKDMFYSFPKPKGKVVDKKGKAVDMPHMVTQEQLHEFFEDQQIKHGLKLTYAGFLDPRKVKQNSTGQCDTLKQIISNIC